jgi:tetratricopeptide (TPR) repeat protein
MKRSKRGRAVPTWVAPLAVGVGLAVFTAWAWPPRDEPEPGVREGNERFARGEFPAALQRYEGAPGDGVRNVGVHMNRGLARVRIAVGMNDAAVLPELAPDAALPESWERAQDEMRNTARGMEGAAVEDIEVALRARALYNLGNTYFAQHTWRQAMDAYKDALRLRPGWTPAAWNLELARRRKDEEDHPDAGPDAGRDASQDSSADGGDSGPQDGGSPNNDGGSPNNDGGAPSPDGGSPNSPDGGSPNNPDGGGDQGQDASAPQPQDASAPQSLAPLDQLERNAQDLRQEILRRNAANRPRNPDDER